MTDVGESVAPARWRRATPLLMPLLLILVPLAILYTPVVVLLFRIWISKVDESHGFLVPLVSGYLIWTRRQKLAALPIDPWAMGIVGLAFGILLRIFGGLASSHNLQNLSLTIVLGSLVALNLGRAYLKELLVPLAFLLLLVRLPRQIVNAIALPLQLLAAKVATGCLSQVGIPVVREGNVIVLASTSLEVAEACSGLRSFEALLVTAGILAYFSQHTLWRRGLLVALSIPIAVAVNVGRVTVTGLLAHSFGPTAAEGFYHTFSGWVAFLLALALLFLTSRLLTVAERRAARLVRGA